MTNAIVLVDDVVFVVVAVDSCCTIFVRMLH